MRPKSLDWFDRSYLASVALSAVNLAVFYPDLKADFAADGDIFFWVTMAITFTVSLLLWYLVARRASNFARWVLVVLGVIELLMLPVNLSDPKTGLVASGFEVVTLLLTVISLWFLFRPDARAWFASSGKKGSVNFRAFD